MKKKDDNINIYEVMDEYSPDYSVFCEDDFETLKLKKIIFQRLTETEKRIILAYAHIGNIRDTARLFKVSSTTIYNEIRKIRKKIEEICYT